MAVPAATSFGDAAVESVFEVGAAPDAVAATPAPLTVVLLGDSYTAGNGARAEDGERAYYGPAKCMRSAGTWGEQYADALTGAGYAVTLLNRACSAATTDAMLLPRDLFDTRVVSYPTPEPEGERQTDAFYREWAASTPDCAPTPDSEEYVVSSVTRTTHADSLTEVSVTCDRWLRAQVDALNPDVDLVMMSVGGNDAAFPHIVRDCLIAGEAAGCDEALAAARSYVRTDFAADLVAVFAEIARRTDGQAKVVYLAYPGLDSGHDLRLTRMDVTGVSAYPVSAALDELAADGRAAQASAVAAANAQFGAGFVTFVDAVPELFEGHEPDARPMTANPERWMYEVFETTVRDEWYHLNPRGHRAIAQHLVAHGDFGAADRLSTTRDIALVIDQHPDAVDAAVAALEDASLWEGARVSIIEHRAAEGGPAERRVVVTRATAPTALAALASDARGPWVHAADLRLSARWNAVTHTIAVDASGAGRLDDDALWAADEQGRAPTTARGAAPAPALGTEVFEPLGTVVEVLASAARAPRAWAGGPYAFAGPDATLDAQGSVGEGDLEFAWDLDGDGAFERMADGPVVHLPAGVVSTGWVSLRVTDEKGRVSVSSAWVTVGPAATPVGSPCVSGTGAGGGGSSARDGCAPEAPGLIVPDADAAVAADPRNVAAGSAPEQVKHPRTLAALTVVPLSIDARMVVTDSGRSRRTTTRDAPGRARPREIVRREAGLHALLRGAAASR